MAAALAVCAAALILRIADVRSQGAPARLAGDAIEYDSYAASMLSTGEYVGPAGERASRMPGYPLFLAAVYRGAGRSAGAALAAQCLLGALTCLLLYFLAASLLEPPWPVLCAAALALNRDAILSSSSVLTECLFAFLLTASLAALHRDAWPGRLRATAAGLGFGAAYWVRPEILPYAVLLLPLAPRVLRAVRGRDAVAGLCVLALFVGLWTCRNFMVFHELLPVSSMGHRTAYLGLRLPLERQSFEAGPMYSPPEGLGELEKDRSYAQALARLKSRLTAAQRAKAHLFNLLSAYYPFLPAYDPTYVFLLPFVAIGLWACKDRRELLPSAGAVLALSASYSFFGGPVSRYRFGFMPLLVLLAAAGARRTGAFIRPRWRLPLGAAWGALNMAVWVWAPRARDLALGARDAFWK